MNFFRLLPVILSFLLMSAHFFRVGQIYLAGACIVILILLLPKKTWVPRLFQVLLIAASLEWLRTLYMFVQVRIAFDEPWTRLAIILGTVALLTALSGLVFTGKALRARYQSEPYQ